MKPRYRESEHTRTAFVNLDTRKCIACWMCIAKCLNNVIGRVNLPWHKHALIINGSNCTGCLKCLDVCESKAISRFKLLNIDI